MRTFKPNLALLVSALSIPVVALAVAPLGPQVNVNAPTGSPQYGGYGKRISACPSGSVLTGLETTQFIMDGDTIQQAMPFNIDYVLCRSTTAPLGPQVNVNAPTGSPQYGGYGKRISACPSGSVLTGLETTQFIMDGDTIQQAMPFNIDYVLCRSTTAPL